MRHLVLFAVTGAVLLAGCRQMRHVQAPTDRELSVGCVTPDCLPTRLDRGDWEVDQGSDVWKVFETNPKAPPRHKGFLVARHYRQARGGATYTVYSVTTLNRREVVGQIDQLGRATRFEPRRNMGFDRVDIGANSLENNVAAILRLKEPANLEKTTERRLAFEALDRNKDGLLQADEIRVHGDRLARADRNKDGVVDFQEFETLDVL